MKTMNKSITWEMVDREIGKQAADNLTKCIRRRRRTSLLLEVIAFIIFAIILILLSLSSTGCRKTLSGSGVYGSNKFLYDADHVIVSSKSDMDAFLTWEMNNRATLAQQKLQSVTIAADSIRTNAPLWFVVAIQTRNAYSNAWYLAAPPQTQSDTSNALESAITTLQTQTLATRALTNSVNK